MISIALGGCGGGGGGGTTTPPPTNPPPTEQTYKVGGALSGLTSGTVVLKNNGGDDLSVTANGTFVFPKSLPNGAAYAVTVATQPANVSCTVTNGSGTIAGANVSNVVVTCVAIVPPPGSYTVGGTVSGLTGTLILKNNGADDLTVTANGVFTFVTPLVDGSNYTATVFAQPNNQTCTVTNGTGKIAGANVTNVLVTCATNPPPPPSTYTVGGTVSGLAGTLVLRNNGADNLTVSANGSFTFATALNDGTAYSVAVFTQPSNQSCTVSNGNGIIAGANVTNVSVNCVTNPPPMFYTVGGTVTGLTGTGLILRNNGSNDLAISNSGNFTFTNPLAAGSAYDVTIAAQPTQQSCNVSNGKGTANSNITTVTVSCFPLQSVIYSRAAAGIQNDLYIVKEDGTATVALENTANTSTNTVVKLNSGKILYESGAGSARSVYIVNADGTGTLQLANPAYLRNDMPIELPSGKVVLTQNSKNLVTVNQDGTGLVTLNGTAGTKSLCGITANGIIVYRWFDSLQADQYSIYSIREDGTNNIKLTPTNTTEYEACTAVTAGGRVVFERRAAISTSNPNDLYSVNSDGTGLVALSAVTTESDDFVTMLGTDRVLYSRGGLLYSVKVDGTAGATLTTIPNSESYVGNTTDGKLIFQRTVYDPVTMLSQADLFIINSDGTGFTKLADTTSYERFQGVMPNGQILFTRDNGSTSSDLYLINQDGTGELRLTNSTNLYNATACSVACVAPNGKLIFYQSDNTQSKLMSINLDGTELMALTTGAENDYLQGITVSSRLIMARYPQSGSNYDLYSMRTDGTDVKNLANSTDTESFIRMY